MDLSCHFDVLKKRKLDGCSLGRIFFFSFLSFYFFVAFLGTWLKNERYEVIFSQSKVNCCRLYSVTMPARTSLKREKTNWIIWYPKLIYTNCNAALLTGFSLNRRRKGDFFSQTGIESELFCTKSFWSPNFFLFSYLVYAVDCSSVFWYMYVQERFYPRIYLSRTFGAKMHSSDCLQEYQGETFLESLPSEEVRSISQ